MLFRSPSVYESIFILEKNGEQKKFTLDNERGLKVTKLDTFVAIANALDVSADALLIDVVTHSVTGATNELSDMIGKLPKDEQRRIINAVRALVD